MPLRDEVVDFLSYWHQRSGLALCLLIAWCGLARNRFYDWKKRYGTPNTHNAPIPKEHWILPWEKQAIIQYANDHIEAGYRRITYMMLDEDIVAVSPSTTYRVLAGAGLLGRGWNSTTRKGNGFEQPLMPHEHWHIDFAYIQLAGTFYFLATVLDGCSRAVLSWRLAESMTAADAEIVLQQAREKNPNQKPRIISDNGPQFLAKDFKQFIRICEMSHVTTSPYYPQSNGKLERFHRTIKGECIRPQTPLDIEDARRLLGAYINDYNEVRLHSAISFVTPFDRLANRDLAIQAGRKEKLKAAKEARKQAHHTSIKETGQNNFFASEKSDTNSAAFSKERGQEIPQPEPPAKARTVLDADRLNALADASAPVSNP